VALTAYNTRLAPALSDIKAFEKAFNNVLRTIA